MPGTLGLAAAAGLLLGALAPAAGAHHPPRIDGSLVLVHPGPADEFAPAAEAMARLHGSKVETFDPADPGALEALLKREAPRHVVFVLPPSSIDVELAHRILEMSVRVDDDPFPDFEYGFITGRDGKAAEAFVGRIRAAWDRAWTRRAALFGPWEGPALPSTRSLAAMDAMGLDSAMHLLLTRAGQEERTAAARAALDAMKGSDALLFFSHGDPHEMVGCYTAAQLREWSVDLAPAVLFNTSCYNGSPGRWWEPTPGGFAERPAPPPEDSVALAILDSGVSGAFLGVDPWHGPLTCQVFCYAVDEGLGLGAAAKRMHDRLALEFLPDRIAYIPAAERGPLSEGTENRRSNGAGMIFYGDPALAPFTTGAERLVSAAVENAEAGPRIVLTVRPLLAGTAGPDTMVPHARLMNYYSVRTQQDFLKQMAMEFYGVVETPRDWRGAVPPLRVVSARVGTTDIPIGDVQAAGEDWHDGPRLHVRVPVAAPMYGTAWAERVMLKGATVVLEAAPQEPAR